MVVLALVGILTTLIVPEMRGTLGDARLRGSARAIIQAVALASNGAVSLNQYHRLRIETGRNRYQVERRERQGAGWSGFHPVRDRGGYAGALDDRLRIEIQTRMGSGEDGETAGAGGRGPDTGREIIGFYPDGTADAAEIRLRDRAGFGLTLEVNPVTARVRVREVPRK